MVKTQVLTRSRLPSAQELGKYPVVIVDRKLLSAVPGMRTWLRGFSQVYPVRAGEGLKQLETFPAHIRKILKMTEGLPASGISIVAIGGGSVGDFAGFVASVLKRGVDLVQIPSTWLAAIDSSHGGKTALNAGEIKNQIGTFYPASRVYLVKPLLMAQPSKRAQEAFGELSKIALIDGRAWVRRMEASRLRGAELIWRFLPEAIESKYRVVRRDPYEKRKIRRILNLGHTMGHVLEGYAGVAHGEAVAHGLLFSLEWSRRLKLLAEPEHQRIVFWLEAQFGISSRSRRWTIPRSRFLPLLKQDKKRDLSGGVSFVFTRGKGKAELRQVSWKEISSEARRQGWIR